MDVSNKSFELIANDSGHAAQSTLVVFEASETAFRASFSGPNIEFGHVVLEGERMLYHALDKQGILSAGTAQVHFGKNTMTLNWRWLTGDRSSGTSRWVERES